MHICTSYTLRKLCSMHNSRLLHSKLENDSIMIETKRLLIKPLTAEELKKHVDSPDDFAKELGLIPSRSLVDTETKEAILNDLLPNIVDTAKDSIFIRCGL